MPNCMQLNQSSAGPWEQQGMHSTCTCSSRRPLRLASVRGSGSMKNLLALQIARQVKDALREAQELAHPAVTPRALESVPEGQQANGHSPSLTAVEADGPAAAAAHQASDRTDGSSAGTGINDVADEVELMMIEGEPLSAGELAMAQAAEQVLRNLHSDICCVTRQWARKALFCTVGISVHDLTMPCHRWQLG